MAIQFDFVAIALEWPLLAKGVAWTLGLTSVSAFLGVLLGVVCAWVRTQGPVWLKPSVGAYVELIRNTPFIVQLFFIFFGLPMVNLGAYSAEIVRAGIEATPRGQLEAAQSLALSRVQTFTHVVLPPALQRVWPALVSQIIIVMLGSAVCGQISTEELSYAANLIQSRNFRAFEAFIVATVLYLLLSMATRASLNWLGRRWLFGGRRG